MNHNQNHDCCDNVEQALKMRHEYSNEGLKKNYTCPMHPEIKQDNPGRCPKCGMDLIQENTEEHATHVKHSDMDHSNHHAMMAQDFKRRFFIALTITIPILILSPTIQGWLG